MEVTNAATTDNKTYTLTTSALAEGTEYTVTVTNVTATGCNALSTYSFKFETASAGSTPVVPTPSGNILPEIYSIEGSKGSYIFKDSDGNVIDWAQADDATLSATEGVVSVTGRSGQAISGIKYDSAPLKSGKKYKVSAKFRMDGTPTGGTDLKAKFYITTPSASNNLAVTPTTDPIAATTLVLGEWVEISEVITVGVASPVSGRSEKGLNIGFKVGQNSNAATFPFSVKDIVVEEYFPCVEVASTYPADGMQNFYAADGIKVTFNTAVGTLTPANFLMSGGASVTDVETTDNKTFTLTTTALSNNTEYTVFVTNVSASGYTTLTSYSFTFKTNDGTAPVPPVQEYDTPNANLGANLLATAGFNWNFEGSDNVVRLEPVVGETDPYYQQDAHKTAWGIAGTCTYGVVTDQDAPDGTDGLGALLVSDRSDEGAGRRINYVAYMPNKTYRASVWVKLADEYATAPVALQFSDAGANKGKVSKYSPYR